MRGPEGEANGDFTLARSGTGEQHVGEIGAGDEPDQADDQGEGGSQSQEANVLGVSEICGGLEGEGGSLLGFGMSGEELTQQHSGLGLRGDWLTSANLMDSFLRGANDALGAGDAASAKDLMEKAERQVDKLEKALNK